MNEISEHLNSTAVGVVGFFAALLAAWSTYNTVVPKLRQNARDAALQEDYSTIRCENKELRELTETLVTRNQQIVATVQALAVCCESMASSVESLARIIPSLISQDDENSVAMREWLDNMVRQAREAREKAREARDQCD